MRILAGILSFLFAVNVFATDTLSTNEKQKHILKTVMYYMGQKHVRPFVLDDAFSKGVWDKFFEYIDPQHKIFLQEDMDALQKYYTHIDDQVKENSLLFFDETMAIYTKRMNALHKLCDNLLAKPFSFTKAESFQEGTTAPKNAAEQKERWRKSLKFSVLRKYATQKESQKDGKEALLEKQSRQAVNKWMTAFFNRMSRAEEAENKFGLFMNAILYQADPHTMYRVPTQAQMMSESISKRFFGIGISMKELDGEFFVDAISPGGATDNSGLLFVGDQILQVENEKGQMVDIFAMPNDDVIALIRGAKDSQVRLRILRKNEGEKVVSLKRTEVKDEAKLARSGVIDYGNNKIGIICLPDFYDDVNNPNGAHASNDVIRHIEALKKEGISSLIIDLRDNPGGSLNEVVKLAGAIVGKGPKVQIKGRVDHRIMNTDFAPIFDGPLAVMINERSASASEIFAAVIQDYKRGVVIGGPSSYGKGTAQETWPIGKMGDASKNIPALKLGSIALTSYLFYRVNGNTTQKSGVIPDILLPSPTAASSLIEKDYATALPATPVATAAYTASDYLTAAQIGSFRSSLSQEKRFHAIDSLSRWLAQQDKAPIALDFKTYTAQQAAKTKAAEQLKKILALAEGQFLPISAQKNGAVQSEKWYTDWLDNTRKDIYVAETVQVLDTWAKENEMLSGVYTIKREVLNNFFEEDGLQAADMEADRIALNNALEVDAGERKLVQQVEEMETAGDGARIIAVLDSIGTDITRKKICIRQQFVKNHPNSPVSLYLLATEYASYTADGYTKAFDGLSGQLKGLKAAKKIYESVQALKVTGVGVLAMDFQRTDQYGKRIKLSDFRGKYVLLDFWGSWCAPCRLSHPHLKELYSLYKAKDFEIVAVANQKKAAKTLAEQKKMWLNAIEEDNIPWVHVLNDEGNGAPDIAEAYDIKGYPTKILLDQEGKVCMRVIGNLNQELDSYLKQHIQ